VRYVSEGVETHGPTINGVTYSGLHGGGFVQSTLQNGSLIGGYYGDLFSNSGGGTFPAVPLGFNLYSTWHIDFSNWINGGITPVADMNAHGEIVGRSVFGATSNYGAPTYAAFSAPTGGTHDINDNYLSPTADNLNTYIASSLGINLTQGLKVDDLGRIIAQGTVDGQTHDFLLTPASLSSNPIPAPEPSTLVLLAVASVGWIVQRHSRD
jgi:hypothetical protein